MMRLHQVRTDEQCGRCWSKFLRGSALAVAFGVSLAGQQPDQYQPTSFRDQIVKNIYDDMRRHNPNDNVDADTTFNQLDDGECVVVMSLISKVNGGVVDQMQRTFTDNCDKLRMQVNYGVKRAAQPKESLQQQINDVLKYFANSRPEHQAASPAQANSYAASVTSPTIIMDLPLEPPLSFGTGDMDAEGCDPPGFYTFRVNHDAGTVTRISGCPLTVAVSIPVASRPLQAELTPDSKTLVVTSYDNAITFIDTGTNQVTGTLQTSVDIFPSGIAITADGSTAYVTSFIDVNPQLLLVDLRTRQISGTLRLGAQFPQNVFLGPDETTAWITFPLANQIYVVDTLTKTVASVLTGISTPYGIAFNRTGTLAYVVSGTSPGSVEVVDMTTYTVIDSLPVGDSPSAIAISPNDRFLAVQNYLSPYLSYIDLTTGTTTQVQTGMYGEGLLVLR
jgi:YVTN family beta-propeller protein